MGSQSKEVRLEQKAYWEAKLARRIAELADKGRDPRAISADTVVRKLRAEVRHAGARLRVIENREQQALEMARKKAEKLATPKVKKAKKKQEEEKQEPSKRRQKKQKKQKQKK